MNFKGNNACALLLAIFFTMTFTASARDYLVGEGLADSSPHNLETSETENILNLRPMSPERPETLAGIQPMGISDAIEAKSFNIDQEDISDSGMLKGEHIDTRTGKLHWEVTELQIPGNGGLDIEISRSFEKGGSSWRPHFGNYGGWEIELPRIEIPQTPDGRSRGEVGKQGICIDPKPIDEYLSSKDELKYWSGMQLLMPNAGPRPIYLRHKTAKHFSGAKYVTEDNWAIKCARDEKGLWGYFTVYSPDGKEYRLEQKGVQSGIASERGMQIYYVTEEKDQAGNWIKYQYHRWSRYDSNNETPYLANISTSDGRLVEFDYKAYYPYGGDRVFFLRLTQMRYADKTWKYSYDKDNSLSKVERPDGSSSSYTYQEYKKRFGGYLRTVTTPQGAKVSYSYKEWYIRNFGASTSKYRHKLVTKRIIEGPGIETSEWQYLLSRDDAAQENISKIIGPKNTEVHRFHRTRDWQLGLMKRQEIYTTQSSAGTPIKTIDYEWAVQPTIGFTEAYVDKEFYFTTIGTPKVLTKRTINGRYQTQYQAHDEYGKAATILEQGDQTRITKLTYEHRPESWLIGLPKSEAIEGGSRTSREYNEQGQVSEENQNGQITKYQYHATGDLASKCWQKDSQEHCESYQDYKRGKPQSTKDAKGNLSYQSINAMGSVTSETDKEGHTTEYAYDSLERLKHIKPPLQADATINWPTPRKREIQHGETKTTTEYNALGWVLTEKQEDQTTGEVLYTRKAYDALGRQIFSAQPSHRETETQGLEKEYDVLGRLVILRNTATGAVSRYCHDECEAAPEMRLGTVITNARGYQTREYKEAYGDPEKAEIKRIEQDTGEARIVTEYDHNIMGKLIRVSQGAEGHEGEWIQRKYQYNAQQRLESEHHPETGETKYSYDEVGNIKTKTQGGESTYYEYDANNQLKAEAYQDKQRTEYQYNKNGVLTRLSNGQSQRDYQYNALGQLTEESLQINLGENSPQPYKLGYEYNHQGSLIGYRYPNGEEYQLTPDGLGRIKAIAGFVDQVEYHANQEISLIKLRNGTETRVEQNLAQLPERIITEKLATGEKIQSLAYQYDMQNNISQIEDQAKAHKRQMQYDGIDRLIREESQKGDSEGQTQTNYQYDAHGNILAKLGESKQKYQYQEGTNRLSQVNDKAYAYDNQGNVIADGQNQYQYNSAKRLVWLKDSQNQTQQYVYDGQGHRVQRQTKEGNTKEVHNQAGQLVYEENDSGESTSYLYIKGQLVAKIKNGPGQIVATQKTIALVSQREVNYLHTNLQGSIEAATDEAGNLLWHEGYQAYGARTEKTQATQDALPAFTGKLEDPSTGLVYMNARYYDPSIGRFLAIDPVGFTPKNLQSFNRYLYVNNNPYKYTDPTGEFFQAVTVTIGALAGGYMGYKESGGSFWGTVQGAAQGAYLGIGVGGVVSGIGFVAKGVATLAKQSVWRSVGTDAAIGAVSAYSGTKATGGSNADAMKNAGFGAVFGGGSGLVSKGKSLITHMLKSGGIGGGTNSVAQLVEINSNSEKSSSDFDYASVAGSVVGGFATGALSFNAPSGLAVTLSTAPRNAMIDTATSSVTENMIKRFQ